MSEDKETQHKVSRREFLLASLLVPGTAILAGCGGGGGSTFHNIPVTDTMREASMAAIDVKKATLAGKDAPTINRALADFMKGRAEFEDAGVSTDGCAWGRFTDGRLAIIINNRPPGTSKAAALPRSVQSRGAGLPQSTQIDIFDALGPAFNHPAQGIQDMISARGYSSPSVIVRTGTIEELKSVQNPGIFFIAGHGGLGNIRGNSNNNPINNPTVFSIWTSDNVRTKDASGIEHLDTVKQQRYAADLDSNRLVYMQGLVDYFGPFNAPVDQWHFAITPAFVTAYMHFAPNCIVYINACSGDNADFKKAVLDKGAGLYVGWTQPIYDFAATSAALFFFDRLLGTNIVPPVDSSNPPPLDWQSIRSAMATTLQPSHPFYYDESPAQLGVRDSRLIFTPGQGDAAVVVPSISAISADWANHRITLTGLFGSKAGTAAENSTTTTAGAPMTVISWTSTTVVLQLPDDCNNVMLSVDGRTGNIVTVPAAQSKIDPTSKSISTGQTATFTASTVATVPQGAFLAYHWSTTGNFGLISDSRGHVGGAGRPIVSTDSQVLYTPNPGASGQDTVTVDITIVNGAQKTDLGPAIATVTVSNGTVVNPPIVNPPIPPRG